jgi:hypothetical protein
LFFDPIGAQAADSAAFRGKAADDHDPDRLCRRNRSSVQSESRPSRGCKLAVPVKGQRMT